MYEIKTENKDTTTFTAKVNDLWPYFQSCMHELKRLEAQVKLLPQLMPRKDPRLEHMLVYLLANHAPRETIVHRVFLEQFAYLSQLDKEER